MKCEDSGIGTFERCLLTTDLDRAKRYLGELATTGEAKADKVIREALTLAAIVAYCRPFTSSNDANGKRRSLAPPSLAESLPDNLKRLHNRIKKQRNQAWAHTDWCAHDPKSYPSCIGDIVISRNPWVAFTPLEVSEFLGLVEAVNQRVVDMLDRPPPTSE